MEEVRKRIKDQLKNLKTDSCILNVKFDGDLKITFDFTDGDGETFPFSVTLDENDPSSALVFIDDSHIEFAKFDNDLSKFFSKMLRQKILQVLVQKFLQQAADSQNQNHEEEDTSLISKKETDEDISLRTRKDEDNNEDDTDNDDEEDDESSKDPQKNAKIEDIDEDGDSRMSQPDDDSFSISRKEIEKNLLMLQDHIKASNSKITGSIAMYPIHNQYFLVRFSLDKSFLTPFHQEILGLQPNLELVVEIEIPLEYLAAPDPPRVPNSKGVFQIEKKHLSTFNNVELKQATDEYSLINYFLRDRLTTALKRNWKEITTKYLKNKETPNFANFSKNDEKSKNDYNEKKAIFEQKKEEFLKKFEENENALVSMGIDKKFAFFALKECKNDVNLAADLAFSAKRGKELKKKIETEKEPNNSSIISIFEEIFAQENSENSEEDSDEVEIFENSEKQEINFDDFFKNSENFIFGIFEFLQERLRTCSSYCVNCDEKLGFNGIKPAVCNKQLCIYQAYEYGLGVDILHEIKNNRKIVDLLISFFWAALMMKRSKRDVLDPYPSHLTYQGAKITDQNLETLCDLLPSVEDLAKHCESTAALRTFLNSKDPELFPLLRWIISSNRSHLAVAPDHLKIPGIGDHLQQYVMLSQTPEKEAQFREKKKKFGSFFAFHGSNFGNWHCILRKGLKNYSNTAFMAVGAAAGPGIYLANDLSMSGGYSMGRGIGNIGSSAMWKNSAHIGTFCCSIVEVLKTPNFANSDVDIRSGFAISSAKSVGSSSSQVTTHKKKSHVLDPSKSIDYHCFPWGWTVQNEDIVCTRIFLVGNRFDSFRSEKIDKNFDNAMEPSKK